MGHFSQFQPRRQQVFDKMVENSVAVVAAGKNQYRNGDTEYPFRQDSYFYYLTGFEESHAIVVLVKKQQKQWCILFCQEKDPSVEMWTGERVGVQGALQLGFDAAYPLQDAPFQFSELLEDITTVYHLIHHQGAFDKKLFSWISKVRKKTRQGIQAPYQFIDLRKIVNELRLIKTPEELVAVRRACEISVHAHIQAMQRCQAGMHEYELEAILLQEFYRQGSRYPAYPSIVASGNNACTLHYTRNNSVIAAKDLVLIDAGAEYKNYAADITRVFPASGQFSAPQQAIYELVLASQMAAIEQVASGVTWDRMQQRILEVLVAGLVDLKILKGTVSTLIAEKAYLPFYMHSSGHWLGLDVHDVGDYKTDGQWRALREGMLLTIEPGLYFAESNVLVPEKWRGIGVRIEDDILVTKQGAEVLTDGAPKTVREIEKLHAL